MTLSFTLKDGRKCKFIINGLYVSGDEVSYDDIEFYINDTLYDGSAET